MPDDAERETVVRRKGEHVDLILAGDMQARRNAWADVQLVHEAVPEVDKDGIDLGTEFLNRRLGAPVMIASMTGGFPRAREINDALAAAAAHHRLAMGVGSQRAALKDPSQGDTYSVVRDHDVPFLAANIGAPQLVPQAGKPPLSHKQIESLVAMIEADALIVHLNFLQEVVQPEGDVAASGVLSAIEHLANHLGIPVIAKETGAGMTGATAARLVAAGCAALDVGGSSGTTFAAVEGARARSSGDARHARLGEVFRDWGIPTPVSLVEAVGPGVPVVATGGLRSGLDIAKAVALGATVGSVARVALEAAVQGPRAATTFFDGLLDEVRTACFLTGSAAPSELATRRVVVTGETASWLTVLGHDPAALARRSR